MKSSWSGYRSIMAGHFSAFIAYRRTLGRKYFTEELALRLFDVFLANRDVGCLAEVTAEVLESFLVSRPRKSPRSYNHLLGVIRRQFDWMVNQKIILTSPLHIRPRRQTARRIPFLFNLQQARILLDHAGNLPDNNRALDRGPTYRTIFALLYGLGLRVGEVSRLTVQDVDFSRSLLVIRKTKFLKDRLVPFGPRLASQLEDYLRLRKGRCGQLHPGSPVFSFTNGNAMHPGTISQTFHQLVARLKFSLPPGVAAPRAHDLRHSFAVGTLLHWYHTGQNPQGRLLHLSTFLGHVNPVSTAVYLTITEELLRAANHRFEQFAAPLLQEATR